MDLYAHSQIDSLEHLLTENNISIARLRGLRLMKDESIVSETEIASLISDAQKSYAINWLQQHDDSTKAEKRHKAFIYKHGDIAAIDFSKIHGKDRKHIKYHWKLIHNNITAQFNMWNKYAGKNVLYVHAKQGGGNRPWYPIDTSHPMYLADIDDAINNVYCDIYYNLDNNHIVKYRMNGRGKLSPIKHECEYCENLMLIHGADITRRMVCKKTNMFIGIYDSFFEGKYYGVGLPGTIHYEKGMIKKMHECQSWKEAAEESMDEYEKIMKEIKNENI